MLLGRELVGKAVAWLYRPEAQEPWCQSLDGLARECPGVLASQSLPLGPPWALLLSICLRGPHWSAEGPVLLGWYFQLGCFSWDCPKSQSRGSALPASGSAGCWLLKRVVMSCRDPVEQLFSLARNGQGDLLGWTLAADSSCTEVGCAS